MSIGVYAWGDKRQGGRTNEYVCLTSNVRTFAFLFATAVATLSLNCTPTTLTFWLLHQVVLGRRPHPLVGADIEDPVLLVPLGNGRQLDGDVCFGDAVAAVAAIAILAVGTVRAVAPHPPRSGGLMRRGARRRRGTARLVDGGHRTTCEAPRHRNAKKWTRRCLIVK